jgi:hypothetical protein
MMNMATLPNDIVAALESVVAGKVPFIARGTVKAPTQGWCQAQYYDAITGAPMSFYDAPTVIAIAIVRQGTTPVISAPTIKIPAIALPSIPSITLPSVKLPSASTISIPTITLPTLPSVTIKTIDDIANTLVNDLTQVQGYRFTCGIAFGWLCDQLNKLMQLIDTINLDVRKIISALAMDIGSAIKNITDTINTISASLNNMQAALNTYAANIQKSISDGLSSVQTNVQDAVNSLQSAISNAINTALTNYTSLVQSAFSGYAANVEASINAGLAQWISSLYQMIGLPYAPGTVQLLSPVQIQNVTKDGFQFYGLSAGMLVSYVAIGRV